MRAPAARTAWAVVAAVPLAVAIALPPTAPGWLFWGATAISCASAAAWAAKHASDPEGGDR